MTGRRILVFCFLASCLFAGSPAKAGDSPPARVGRIAAADGPVAVRQPGDGWTDSEINEPVAAGTSVRSDAKGRARLSIGADTVALAAGTELDVTQLDASGTQIVLRKGRIGVRLSPLDPAHSIEIDIPRGGVWLLTPGDYEIAAGDEHDPARVAVLDGRARLVGSGIDTAVATGSAVELRGSAAVESRLDAASGGEFAGWWRPAAGGTADPPALRYVSAETTGYDALDANGRWESVDGYGMVWFPSTTPDGWAPYRDGHWRWIRPWGWTWIDDLPWGFATSHYGRWARIPEPETRIERWGWVPGTAVAHPGYMPAAVAFLGTAGVGLSYPDASGPAVAWFPLAPGEVYWPSFTQDLDAIRRLNAGAVTDLAAIKAAPEGRTPVEIVNADYQNRRFASVVPRAVFLGGKPVAAALITLPERRLENAPLLAGSPQIAPSEPRAAARTADALRTLARILDAQPRPAAVRSKPPRPRVVAVAVVRRAASRHSGGKHAARGHTAERHPHAAHRHLRLAAARRR